MIFSFYKLLFYIRNIFKSKIKQKRIKGSYPLNVRFIDTSQSSKVIVTEGSPGKRIVFHYGEGREVKPICLYFPYSYFVIRYYESISPEGKSYVFKSMSVGFSSFRISDTKGLVYQLPLTNSLGHFEFCLGSACPGKNFKTVRQLVDSYVTHFWASSFASTYEFFTWEDATKLGRGDAYCFKKMFFSNVRRTAYSPILHLINGIQACDSHLGLGHSKFADYSSKADEALQDCKF